MSKLGAFQDRMHDLIIVLLFVIACSLFILPGLWYWGAFPAILGLVLLREWEAGVPVRAKERYAGFWGRFLAGLVDLGVFFLIDMIGRALWGRMYYEVLPAAVMAFLYFLLLLYLLKRFGCTPGKMVLGIQVLGTDLSPIGWGKAFLRTSMEFFSSALEVLRGLLILTGVLTLGTTLAGPADQAPFAPGLPSAWFERVQWLFMIWYLSEFLVLLTNRRRRALHDLLAGTVVVKNAPAQAPVRWVLFSILVSAVWVTWSVTTVNERTGYLAEKGDPESQYLVGLDAYTGGGVESRPRDLGSALHWIGASADQGYPDAQYHLGLMYELGDGVEVDLAKAKEWYLKAAQNGVRGAQEDLDRLKGRP